MKKQQEKISSKDPLRTNAHNISKIQDALPSEKQELYLDTLDVNISQDISSYNPKTAITPCINEDTLCYIDEESLYTSDELEEEV
jgi:hypothetical protein